MNSGYSYNGNQRYFSPFLDILTSTNMLIAPPWIIIWSVSYCLFTLRLLTLSFRCYDLLINLIISHNIRNFLILWYFWYFYDPFIKFIIYQNCLRIFSYLKMLRGNLSNFCVLFYLHISFIYLLFIYVLLLSTVYILYYIIRSCEKAIS